MNKEKQLLVQNTEQFSSDSKVLAEKVEEKEREFAQLLSARETLQNTCSSLETTVSRLQSELEEIRKENVDVRNELRTADEAKCNLVKQADELIANSKSLNEEIFTRELRLEDLQKELLTMKDESSRTVETLTQIRQTNGILVSMVTAT